MTNLAIAKARTAARTETNIAYRGPVSNPDWPGMAVTIAQRDGNGGAWGSIEQPKPYVVAGGSSCLAIQGGTTSVGVDGSKFTDFTTWGSGVLIGGSLRVYRATSNAISLVRTATVEGAAVDYWSIAFGQGSNVIAGNSFEFRFDSTTARGTYTFGVARVSGGLIGPVATVSIDVTSPTYTTLTPVAPTSGASRGTITGRNPALPAVTGLTAQLREGTTHNVQLAWDAGAPDSFVVFINWDGSADRLSSECSLALNAGPEILAGDMLIFESAPILAIQNEWISRRVRSLNLTGDYAPNQVITGYMNNAPNGRTWQYVAYGESDPKPDTTYPNYFLRLNGTASLPARMERFFHSGTDQSFYDVLVPGRTYRARIRVRAASNMNATFAVAAATLSGSGTVALTTSWQEFDFDFTRSTLLKSGTAQSWTFTGASNNVSLDVALVQVWDTSRPYLALMRELPEGIDVRDHHLIKEFPPPTLDAITARSGFGAAGWTLVSLLAVCAADNCNPHFQIEWLYNDQFYYDLVTFLYAPASSGEPLALKREALGFGPVHTDFARHIYEDGNERWNNIMWQVFTSAPDSVTGVNYTNGQLSAMFARRRRAIMESNPYWPVSNPPVEWVGGWASSATYTTQAASFPEAEYTSVAAYTSGWDVNRIVLSDTVLVWDEIMGIGQRSHRPFAGELKASLEAAGLNVRMAIYEAGPGYQLNGLNGATITKADEVLQEAMTKSIGGTTAMMTSMAIFATEGVGPYNFFTWGAGDYWQAARRAADGEGLYRVAGFLTELHKLLGRCRVYRPSTFRSLTREAAILSGQQVIGTRVLPRTEVFHFESFDHPGRHGILYCNTQLNRDAFGVGHPDYVEGETGAAEFRYHTGLPSSATPFKVLRNEGNMRHHDAYKVGFRPNVVGGAIDGYVEDPLCVDLTLTPEDFTVDDPTLRTLTLLGGNCRLEVFAT